ncbi:MAG: YegS/Rv2252/BmrU family lipid kinase [Oscillospiraceae bacterium]|nr:YegS/Rv2252/BmrU family lipid kinase [Oscillospiraceae bacterium]
MENKKRNVLLIVNPCAGRTKSRAGTFDIVNKFSTNDYEFSIHTTTCQGDATNIVRKNYDDKQLVVCCGGDGTLNETINGVMDMPNRLPIGYIPTGSTNDLATTLGIPTDINKATDLIMSGHTNSYDLGLFNNRYFSYVASFGAFTKSSYATSQKMKNRLGHMAYILNGIGELKNIRAIHMKIEYDGGVLEDDFMFGSVSNSTSVAGLFRFKPEDVKLNDGIFELLLVKKISLASVPIALGKIRAQQYDGKQIILLRTSKVKITSDEPVAWTLDGEYGGAHKTVMIHVLEKAVEICSPENELFEKDEFFESEPIEEEKESVIVTAEKKRSKKLGKKERKNSKADVPETEEERIEEINISEETDTEEEKVSTYIDKNEATVTTN